MLAGIIPGCATRRRPGMTENYSSPCTFGMASVGWICGSGLASVGAVAGFCGDFATSAGLGGAAGLACIAIDCAGNAAFGAALGGAAASGASPVRGGLDFGNGVCGVRLATWGTGAGGRGAPRRFEFVGGSQRSRHRQVGKGRKSLRVSGDSFCDQVIIPGCKGRSCLSV